MKEIWKDIPGYEGIYQVSNLGRVKSLERIIMGRWHEVKTKEKILKPRITNGYLRLQLFKSNKAKNFFLHRLVAMAFISNPNNYIEINHKDENHFNNNVNNLEWCSHSYNINYGTRTKKTIEKVCKPILQYDMNGNFIKKWKTMNEAIRYYNNVHICDVCKGKRQNASGYIWKYKDN